MQFTTIACLIIFSKLPHIFPENYFNGFSCHIKETKEIVFNRIVDKHRGHEMQINLYHVEKTTMFLLLFSQCTFCSLATTVEARRSACFSFVFSMHVLLLNYVCRSEKTTMFLLLFSQCTFCCLAMSVEERRPPCFFFVFSMHVLLLNDVCRSEKTTMFLLLLSQCTFCCLATSVEARRPPCFCFCFLNARSVA